MRRALIGLAGIGLLVSSLGPAVAERPRKTRSESVAKAIPTIETQDGTLDHTYVFKARGNETYVRVGAFGGGAGIGRGIPLFVRINGGPFAAFCWRTPLLEIPRRSEVAVQVRLNSSCGIEVFEPPRITVTFFR